MTQGSQSKYYCTLQHMHPAKQYNDHIDIPLQSKVSLNGVIRSLYIYVYSAELCIIICTQTYPLLNLLLHALFMYIHIYVADMHLKEVSKCTVTSEQSIFSKHRIHCTATVTTLGLSCLLHIIL